jgi:hypothetical protein
MACRKRFGPCLKVVGAIRMKRKIGLVAPLSSHSMAMSPDERAELELFFKQMKRKKKQKPSGQPPATAAGS